MGVIFFFFIEEKIWNVNIFIEMSKLFFVDKRVERSSARHLSLCRLLTDPWHPARACAPKQGCKTHPVWTAVWLFERDLNIPSVCAVLVIEFFKQLTTLLLNLRPNVQFHWHPWQTISFCIECNYIPYNNKLLLPFKRWSQILI